MVSLSTLILCISIAFVGLTIQESSAGTHHYKLPGKNVTHTYHYQKPGHNVTHTYQYKKPGTTNTHHYQYKTPGMTNTHHYQYKKPGMTNTHTYHYRNPDGSPQNSKSIPNLINVIYNYFAVGGHLTGIPPVDLVLLRYYIAQGPKNFCPKH